ncbi:phosphatase PAP2 family protein [Actinomycetospora cinnamomea]|uniref:5'-phosphoribosyl-monophospho-decaprenol phosphatase n=1 Tax=Actinomycetospora cinnamomea TaxID=663609 RepID=A0A2U1FBL6_9PSEU|nr:phosphatase PAP2 family protein [Actinomycetospora cinnamomea]PVZ09585.1 5'-phosphoribosyl-monophospho-decaprenol phosphatase [Actinomycetospora cinnamomea]
MLDRAEGAGVTVGPARGEVAVLSAVQRRLATPPVVGVARAMSLFGEHAAGWIALGALGAALDPPRRRRWGTALAGVVAAHGASIAVKRVVRRRRPRDPRVAVHVGTPSRLSFPSSHASSTTAAALLYAGLVGGVGAGAAGVVVPGMALSRVVLGVHYPTDVLAGSVLGVACAVGARRAVRRGSIGRWRTA